MTPGDAQTGYYLTLIPIPIFISSFLILLLALPLFLLPLPPPSPPRYTLHVFAELKPHCVSFPRSHVV